MTWLRTNLYIINKNGIQTNTSKIDDIPLRGGMLHMPYRKNVPQQNFNKYYG